MTPATPAAAWVWPMLDLIEPSHSGWSVGAVGGRRWRASAWASMGSPRVVPVPWASTASMSVGGEAGVGECWRMTRCWAGPLGAVRPLVAPSWLIALPRMTAQHLVAVALGVGEPFQQQQADALGPAGAVGAGGEGLAAAVGGQPALAAELDEHGRGGHDGDAAGEGQVALAVAQRLGRQVEGDQRGGAGGVDGDGGAFEAEGVGDAAGGDAAGAAGAPCSLRVRRQRGAGGCRSRCTWRRRRRRCGCRAGLSGSMPACSRASQAISSRSRCWGSMASGFARGDAEEVGVELGGVVQEAAASGVGVARRWRGRGRRGCRCPSRGRWGSR